MKKIFAAAVLLLVVFSGAAFAGPSVAKDYIDICPLDSGDVSTVGGTSSPVECWYVTSDEVQEELIKVPLIAARLGDVDIHAILNFCNNGAEAIVGVNGINISFDVASTDAKVQEKMEALRNAGAVMKIYDVVDKSGGGNLELVVDGCEFTVTSSDISVVPSRSIDVAVEDLADYYIALVTPKSSGSSGGCNAGLRMLALLGLAFVPVICRRK